MEKLLDLKEQTFPNRKKLVVWQEVGFPPMLPERFIIKCIHSRLRTFSQFWQRCPVRKDKSFWKCLYRGRAVEAHCHPRRQSSSMHQTYDSAANLHSKVFNWLNYKNILTSEELILSCASKETAWKWFHITAWGQCSQFRNQQNAALPMAAEMKWSRRPLLLGLQLSPSFPFCLHKSIHIYSLHWTSGSALQPNLWEILYASAFPLCPLFTC